MPTPEINGFLEELSLRLECRKPGINNEVWLRCWLEIEAKKQNQELQCPECGAFVPIRPETFDEFGDRICFLCEFKFFSESEY